MLRTLIPCLVLVAGLALVARAEDEAPAGPVVGKPAPDYRLNDHTGTARTLAEARKEAWVVLAFFPKADTPG